MANTNVFSSVTQAARGQASPAFDKKTPAIVTESPQPSTSTTQEIETDDIYIYIYIYIYMVSGEDCRSKDFQARLPTLLPTLYMYTVLYIYKQFQPCETLEM